ncbi:MAG: metal ABC transporter ATP-binding protein [Halanaerobiaceae bacterium]
MDGEKKQKQLQLKNVSVFYNSNPAIKDINLSIYKNQFLGILGPNGGGKTTLLKVIAGLQKPDQGQVIYYPATQKSKVKNSIGYVPQTSNFDNNFPVSVFDVILMGGLKPGFHPFQKHDRQKQNQAEDIMEQMGITDLKNRQIGQLSGGQLQKVLISRALMTEPQLMLLDEPTSSLDSSSSSNIYDLLAQLNEKMTIIVVTHNITTVSSYFDSLACLNIKLHYHDDKTLDPETVKEVFGCPVDLIAHGIPHRVLAAHEEEE